MSKKQKMKMLAAILAAGSLYISNGTAFAEAIQANPMGQGMTQESKDEDITIVIDEMNPDEKDPNKFVFNEENIKDKDLDLVVNGKDLDGVLLRAEDGQQYINFKAEGAKTDNDQNDDRKLIISSLSGIKPEIVDINGNKCRVLADLEGNKIYQSIDYKHIYDENGTEITDNDELEQLYKIDYQPLYRVWTDEHSLDLGSKVRVDTTNDVVTSITVNGEKFDTNTIEFDKNKPGVGGGDYKGNWQVTDKTTGEVYENTTLDKVESSSTANGYGKDYTIFDTAGNKLNIEDVASAEKLEQVAGDIVTGGNINSETGKITITQQDGNSIELGGQLTDSQLVSGMLNKDTGKLTLTSEDKYTHQQTTVIVDDIASKENLDNLTTTVGAKDTNSLTESYKDTNYIQNAGNMVNADIILDGKLHDVVGTVGSSTTEEMKNAYKDTNYIHAAGNMNEADIILDKNVGNLSTTVGSSTTEEMENAYKDTNYIHAAGNMNEADIILDKNVGNLSTTVGSSTTEEMKNAYKDTNYIHAAGNMNEADIILDKNVGNLSTTIGGATITELHNRYANTNYINSATDMADADVKLDAAIKDEANTRFEQDNIINNRIDGLGNRIDSMDGRISKVGAGAAALAALHPLDFDPDDKLSFAVGYGNYRGEHAAALGAFYQPNEDTLFSVGGTVGNDENMVNVGVSFKLGQKNHVSNNRVSMAKEIISLRDKVAKLEALMTQQGLVPQSEVDMSKFFPDVPENHWAYEYVKELAGLGILEGYPDGTFSGDRMMTRYEFAAITYRALQKGINVDKKMLAEFEPELKLIRVDVVATDKDGNPTIERVRTNEQK